MCIRSFVSVSDAAADDPTVAAASNPRDRDPLPGFHPSIRWPTSSGHPQESAIIPVPKAITIERAVGFEDIGARVVIDDHIEIEELIKVEAAKVKHHGVLAEKSSIAEKETEEEKNLQMKHHVVLGNSILLAEEFIEENKEVQSAHHVVENALVIEEEATELLELHEIPKQTPVISEPRIGAASCILDQDMGRDPVAEVTTAFLDSPSHRDCVAFPCSRCRRDGLALGPDSCCFCPATGREAVGRELDNQNHVYRFLCLRVCPLV
jgi:hypothetical protein